ncbi:hypothetical protein ACQP2K_38125 [Microbispora siamensis]
MGSSFTSPIEVRCRRLTSAYVPVESVQVARPYAVSLSLTCFWVELKTNGAAGSVTSVSRPWEMA